MSKYFNSHLSTTVLKIILYIHTTFVTDNRKKELGTILTEF